MLSLDFPLVQTRRFKAILGGDEAFQHDARMDNNSYIATAMRCT